MHNDSTVRIPLNSRKYPGLYALIDEADFELVSRHQWYPQNGGNTFYAASRISGKHVAMHRLINRTPDNLHTDHINGDGLDNRRENLRSVVASQNLANAHTPVRSVTGYIGVQQDDRDKKPFLAIVRGATVGRFGTVEEAARKVDLYRRVIWGEHVKLNFPEERPDIGGETIRSGRVSMSDKGSRYRGVYFDKLHDMWKAQIRHRGKNTSIGLFAIEEEAAVAYDFARISLGLPPVNFPENSIT